MAASPVFGTLSQEELDRAYDQDHWAVNAAEVQARIIARSTEVARAMPPLARRYGQGVHQVIDIFAPPDAQGAPVFAMIHGGAWRMAMREAFYGPAPAILAAGCILAVIGFDCLPAVSLVEMAGQIRHALAWMEGAIDAFGGDRRNLNLIGHSSGAHLAAAALIPDEAAGPAALSAIRSATLISGLYDLEPVMLSSRRSYIALTRAQVTALSPIRHVERIMASVSVLWGTGDSPEFRRQSAAFAEALQAAGSKAAARMLPGRNHFEMLAELWDAGSPVVAEMLAAARRP